MDKYEYNLKLDQMKSLMAEEKYEDAAELADTVNWNKVKNPTALLRAGEIYEKVERYDDSRDVLLMAYDRSPIGRAIIYRLAEVSIKLQDFDAAQDYYNEFVEIAPHDNLKYVLRYDMKKARGASCTELIPILEELKEQEYTEEWAYELAYLYHKAGLSEKCIDACDELILWFGDGPYVERALELKMLYQPLTRVQEEKYRSFRQAKDGYTHIGTDELQRAGDFSRDSVAIPQVQVSTERYNTVNLQEEIARGMQQIMDATEKSAVADTLDNINKMVEDIPYLKLPREEAEETHIETDEEIDGSLKINFQELLGEDSDGQMSLVMDDKGQVERQITGQLTIQDVLEEWERTKRAAETAMQEAEQRKLESAKARALQQAGNIMDRLTDAKPKLDAGVTPRELLEEEYLQGIPQENEAPAKKPGLAVTGRLFTVAEDVLPEPENADTGFVPFTSWRPRSLEAEQEPAGEPERAEEPEPAPLSPWLRETEMEAGESLDMEQEEPAPEPAIEQESEELIPEFAGEPEPVEPVQEFMVEPEEAEPESAEGASTIEVISEDELLQDNALDAGAQLERELTGEAAAEPTGSLDQILEAAVQEELKSARADFGAPQEEEPEPPAEEPKAPEPESEVPKPKPEVPEPKPAAEEPEPSLKRQPTQRFKTERWKAKTARLPDIREPEDLGAAESAGEPEPIEKLTDDQKKIFSYFIPVKGMEGQLCKALTGVSRHLTRDGTPASGNLIVQGGQGCGKTTLATSVVKVLQQETEHPNDRIGKIHAEALNRREIEPLLEKVAGGCLIIEQAGEMERETVMTLSRLMAQDKSGLLVILEDTSKGIKKALSYDEAFAKRFAETITVPIFTNDELVTFAKSYAKELGYEIDEMAVLALYKRISSIQRLDQATTLTEVKDIVDEAIQREAHGGVKKFFSILTANRYTDDDCIVLNEKDFE